MATYDLTFVAIGDASATLWGSAADLTQEWSYSNTFSDITFSNPSALSVVDDDANFDDDDSQSWSTSGNTTGAQQALPDGTVIEPEFTYQFTTSDGSTYEAIVVYEVDEFGAPVGVLGFVFADPPPPFDTTLTITSATKVDYPSIPYGSIAPVCFTPGMLIRTAQGEKPVESLRIGDMVATLDHGLQPVKMIAQRMMRFDDDSAKHRPIQIRKGALGRGLPRTDLIVSPQHRVLMKDGTAEVLVAAKSLLGRPGVRQMKGKRAETYIHVMFDQHEIIFANGAPTESFFPGPQAMASVDQAVRDELMALYPLLAEQLNAPAVEPARMMMKVQEAKQIARSLMLPAMAA